MVKVYMEKICNKFLNEKYGFITTPVLILAPYNFIAFASGKTKDIRNEYFLEGFILRQTFTVCVCVFWGKPLLYGPLPTSTTSFSILLCSAAARGRYIRKVSK